VSKKAGKRTKATKELPLVSRDWWSLDKTRGYCHKHMGDWRIADDALLVAVNQGKLPVKIEWFDQRTSPPAQHRILLSVEDYELGAYDFHKVWLVQPRRPDVPAISQRHALFFWGPKAKELWPMEAAEPASGEQQATDDSLESPRRRPGPAPEKEWKQAVVRELLKRAKTNKPLPSAPEMLEFCGSSLEWEPDPRSMQALLRLFNGEIWYLLGLG
jgi:hypothetical protein